MADRKAQWYRCRLDAEGKLIECTPVEEVGTDSGGVFYVQALSEALAGKRAYNSYYRLRQRAHRAKLRAAGKCKCGRPCDTDGVGCSHCRERNKLYDKRAEARRRGEVIEPLARKESRDERRAEEAQQARLAVLLEVEKAWKRAVKERSSSVFTAWLGEQLKRAGKRERAA